MAWKSTYQVAFRRRREGKTDYRKRLALMKSGKPKLVVRKSNSRISLELMEMQRQGDKVIVSADTRELKKYGWNAGTRNISAAYLAGFLCGTKAVKKEVKEAVLDIGLATPVKGSRIYAALKGAIDAGLKLPASEAAFPPAERISGKHVADYAGKLGEEGVRKRFNAYLQRGINPADIVDLFEKTKAGIQGSGSESGKA